MYVEWVHHLAMTCAWVCANVCVHEKALGFPVLLRQCVHLCCMYMCNDTWDMQGAHVCIDQCRVLGV